MIISHSHKLIYWKPVKVAGSSILQAIGAQCHGDTDVVLRPNDLEGLPDRSRNADGWHSHTVPQVIRKSVSAKMWDEYLKITVVRNPWDIYVSHFWYQGERKAKVLKSPDHFEHVVSAFRKRLKNIHGNLRDRFNCYYLDSDNRPLADVYLRFENLEEDYKELCHRIHIKYKPLPHLKSNFRKIRSPYWHYYGKQTRDQVADWHQNVIEQFGYKFGY